jgi:hypothetical protein
MPSTLSQPEYAAAAKILSNLPNPVPLAKIDTSANSDIAERWEEIYSISSSTI